MCVCGPSQKKKNLYHSQPSQFSIYDDVWFQNFPTAGGGWCSFQHPCLNYTWWSMEKVLYKGSFLCWDCGVMLITGVTRRRSWTQIKVTMAQGFRKHGETWTAGSCWLCDYCEEDHAAWTNCQFGVRWKLGHWSHWIAIHWASSRTWVDCLIQNSGGPTKRLFWDHLYERRTLLSRTCFHPAWILRLGPCLESCCFEFWKWNHVCMLTL